jgi:hypothetical protein
MRVTRALALAALAATSACQLPFGAGSDAGTDAASAADGGTSSATDVVGADCTAVAPSTTLCGAISACPNVLIDPGQFPHCGFRIHGTVLDLECWCSGKLCPVGVATTCDQIPPLLADQTEDTVCVQVNEGRCTDPSGTSSGGGSGSGGGTCDKTCQAECAGDPSCMQQCGC